MKNFVSSYTNHPEVLFIFLILLFFFMLIKPLVNLLIAKLNKNKFESLENEYDAKIYEQGLQNILCTFCKSPLKIKELVFTIPKEVRFGLFFLKENGYRDIYICRCAKCNTKLFAYTQSSGR